MANKVYYLDRDGATPQVVPANTDEKLKVYDSYEDIDTTELVDGEIVSTKEVAADGSNVYDHINEMLTKENLLSDWENITLPTTEATAITMEYDGLICVSANASASGQCYARLIVNGVTIGNGNTYSADFTVNETAYVQKGDTVYLNILRMTLNSSQARFYKQRYYGGRQ